MNDFFKVFSRNFIFCIIDCAFFVHITLVAKKSLERN